MKNFNMSGLGFQNSVNSLELQEARKKMNTTSNQMGMTSSQMSGNSMTSFGSLPNLINSKYTSQTEIQQAMQQMNRFS